VWSESGARGAASNALLGEAAGLVRAQAHRHHAQSHACGLQLVSLVRPGRGTKCPLPSPSPAPPAPPRPPRQRQGALIRAPRRSGQTRTSAGAGVQATAGSCLNVCSTGGLSCQSMETGSGGGASHTAQLRELHCPAFTYPHTTPDVPCSRA